MAEADGFGVIGDVVVDCDGDGTAVVDCDASDDDDSSDDGVRTATISSSAFR